MATFKVISVVLFLSVSTIINGFFHIPDLPVLKIPDFYEPQPALPPAKPTKPPAFSPVKDSRYCDESEITKLFSGEGRKKRTISKSWPYDCTYPSIINYQGKYQFMYNIYTCCKKCDFPTYTKCVKHHGSPDWRCPSDGVHCILECVKRYGPGSIDVIAVKPIGGDFDKITGGDFITPDVEEKVIEVPKKVECEKLETLANGKTCIRRLCVPLKT